MPMRATCWQGSSTTAAGMPRRSNSSRCSRVSNPDDSVVRSMLGYAHLATGNFTGAVVELQRYVALEPDSANGHHSLGDAYRAQGEFELATDEYNKALAADPSFHLATTSLAVVEVLQGRLSGSGSAFDGSGTRIETAPPKDRVDAVFELASVFRCRGRFREAIRSARLHGPGNRGWSRSAKRWRCRCAGLDSPRSATSRARGGRSNGRSSVRPACRPGTSLPGAFSNCAKAMSRRSRRTANEIVEFALPADDPDRTEDKAAAYLEGMALLAEGRSDEAIDRLSLAVASEGYEYAIYRLGLAEAYLAARTVPRGDGGRPPDVGVFRPGRPPAGSRTRSRPCGAAVGEDQRRDGSA